MIRKGNEPKTPEERQIMEANALFAERTNTPEANKLRAAADHYGLFPFDLSIQDEPEYQRSIEEFEQRQNTIPVAEADNEADKMFGESILNFIRGKD